MNNLPLGAENDPRAPYNKKEIEITVFLNRSLACTVDEDTWESLSNSDKKQYLYSMLKDELCIDEEIEGFEED